MLRRNLLRAVPLGGVLLTMLVSGCDGGDPEFAIYLVTADAGATSETPLADVELPADPLVSRDDIVSYEGPSHELELTAAAFARLGDLELAGRTFVVAVGREPVYRGTFMAPWMSRSDDGVVIMVPPLDTAENVIRIQLGYPGADFFRGEDPRSDERVLTALRIGH